MGKRETRSAGQERVGASQRRASDIRIEPAQLPKAGGAISGLPETFGCEEFSGAATLTIPFSVSAARGLEPEVAIRYRSGGGNGPFGIGFGLDLPSVARRTNLQLPRYDGSDRFSLSGGPALVPSPDAPQQRTVDGVDYSVTQYRPRAFEQASRIEEWRGLASDAHFWRTIDATNRITVYGRTSAAQIVDPADPTRVFEWLIEWEADARGNAISYAYKPEDDDGLAGRAGEAGRSYGATRYLERIRYGNAVPVAAAPLGLADPAAAAWYFEIVADYGEYDLSPDNGEPYTPVRPWPARADVFSTYSAGFERRTARLCRNVLLFHNFPELGAEPVLVRSLALGYAEDPILTRLTSACVTGHRLRPAAASGARYWTRALPALTLDYTPFAPEAARFVPVAQADGAPLTGLDGGPFSLVDLYGEGAPGILYADGESTLYRAPRAANASGTGPLAYQPQQPCPEFAIERRATGGDVTLLDIDGDSRLELQVTAGDRAGSYKIHPDGSWAPFRAFDGVPTEFHAPGAEHVDLTGSGAPDLALFWPDTLRYYPLLGGQGYGDPVQRNPAVAPLPVARTDKDAVVRFADLCGTGTPQRVRIIDGVATCWPSLGYGRFAPPITLTGQTVLGPAFNARRIVLADLDGSGAADLIYAQAGQLLIFRNLSGNGFAADPLVVPLPAPCIRPDQIHVADIRGNGWECLVFSEDGPQPRHWLLDLCEGVKPYLLARIDNAIGTETRINYASSSRFQLEDREAGNPWATSLAAPIQIVESIEEREQVGGQARTTVYRYRDGAMDPVEREFRGFGMVESVTSEPLPDPAPGEHVAATPVLTRSWYHLGIDTGEDPVTGAFAGDAAACPMPGPLLEWPQGFVPDAETLRQALVALAGGKLRDEIYALDGSALAGIPYSVSQHRYRARLVQPRGAFDAVFLTGDAESIDYAYERDAADPRVTHAFTLLTDPDGIVRQTAGITYPRRPGHLLDDLEQGVLRASCAAVTPLAALSGPDLLLIGLADTAFDYALAGLPTPDTQGYFSWTQMETLVAEALSGTPPTGLSAQLLSGNRQQWVVDSGGVVTPQALPLRLDVMAFDAATIAAQMQGVAVPGGLDAFLTGSAGYDRDGAEWWQAGPQAEYAGVDHFYRLETTRDAFAQRESGPSGTITRCTYDAHDLLVVGVETSGRDPDVAPRRVTATRLDYQALSPLQITDANGIVSETIADPLGFVLATSQRGHEWIDGAGQPVGFAALPLDDPQSWPVADSMAALLAEPAKFLAGAQAVFLAMFADPAAPGAPSAEISVTATDYPLPSAPDTAQGVLDVSVHWTDGHARAAQQSDLASNGKWRISGRSLLLFDGEPWRAYQPLYADAPDFLPMSANAGLKFTTTHAYDALGRPARTSVSRGDLWEAFFATTVHTAWDVTESDLDDTIKDSTWYRRYVAPGDATPPLPPAEKAALEQAALFYATPSTTILANDGTVVALASRLTPDPDPPLVTRRRLDAAGRVDAQADPRLAKAGIWNLEQQFDLRGQVVVRTSVDSGTTRSLVDAVGSPILIVDAMGRATVTAHDSLGRLATLTVQAADGTSRVVERIVYGDSLDGTGQPPVASAAGRNLVGAVVLHYDAAGAMTVDAFALGGEPLSLARGFLSDYAADADWTWAAPTGWTWAAMATALDGALDPERFAASRRYDALGRPVSNIDPAGNLTVIDFGPGGEIATLSTSPLGAETFTYLDSITYAPDGRRTAERMCGPGGSVVARKYAYDPDDLRLTGIAAQRLADGKSVQALAYVYDPVGNVTQVDDAAAPGAVMVSAGQIVTPVRDFTFDALYRLTGATGRAHSGFTRDSESSGGYDSFFALARTVADPGGTYRYAAQYAYDDGGNLTRVRVTGPSSLPAASWTRSLSIDAGSNRGVDTDWLGGRTIDSFFDAAGNQIELSGLPALDWDYRNLLRRITLVGRTEGPSDAQYIAYDASGQRVRRTTHRLIGGGNLRVEDTFYFGGVELTRVRSAGTLVEALERLRLMDAHNCIAERLKWTTGAPPAGITSPQLRYQIEDRQGSSSIELDEAGLLVSYEEYAPYGVTVFAAGPSLAEVALKRYRFSGKLRDAHSGLYDFGARHYAPWLGRWLSPDPAGPVDGLNLYAFVGGNPVTWEDPDGLVRTKQTGRKKGGGKGAKGGKANKGSKRKVNASPGSIVKPKGQANQKRARVFLASAPRSSRLREIAERVSAQFQAPTGKIGHYYSGYEHIGKNGGKPLFSTFHALHDDIKSKIQGDIFAFTLTGKGLATAPQHIIDYAKQKSTTSDFLESATETVSFNGKSITRIKATAGRIVPRDGAGSKVGAAVPHGGIVSSRDDKGHGVPEKGVSDTNSIRVNGPDNVFAEQWVINQQYKTEFERHVKDYAVRNPGDHVMTIHLPNYTSSKGEAESFRSRPKEIIHFMAINGNVVSAFTFKNSKNIVQARAN